MNNLVNKHEYFYSVATENTFDFLSDEYQKLFEQSSATVFQAPFWLTTFYKKLTSESGAQPHIITLRNSEGVLCFVLPCVKQQFNFFKIVQPADLGTADYNSFVTNEETFLRLNGDEELRAKLLKVLKPYDIFFFRKQREDSPQIQDVISGGQISKSEFNSHEVKIGTDFDAWCKKSLSKNFQKQSRRKANNINRDLGGIDVSILKDRTEILNALTFIRKQRGAKFQDDILHQDNYFEFYAEVAENYSSTGDVIVSAGIIRGQIVVAEMGVVLNGTYSCLLAAFLPNTYDKYSIGVVGIFEIMRILVSNGKDTYDFALGDEAYKERFGTTEIRIDNVVYAGTLVGVLLSYIYAYAKPLKNYLKKFIPSLN
jgi:CelD/BcsL family acetyltransferase involved in cellulose biosynthesis